MKNVNLIKSKMTEELEIKHYNRMMNFLIADFKDRDFEECDIILRQIIKVAYVLLNEKDDRTINYVQY